MSAFLIDTNIVSELARKHPDPGVTNFMTTTPKLLVSTILFHELHYGLETASIEVKARLTSFYAALRDRFGAAAIAVNLQIAETSARLRAFEKAQGRVLTLADSIMAATAINVGATLVTRNVKDFDNLGIEIINPFAH
jgi:predicted nucleic acid-binding protein